ncbi:MAG: hypothetical protein WCT77_03610 [Bacteroidota bacterium]|jgi:hypothetical protein
MKIVEIKYLFDYKLIVKIHNIKGVFNDSEKIIDLEAFLKTSNNRLVEKYLDKSLFSKVYLDDTGTPCWGDNEFDINPLNIFVGKYDAQLSVTEYAKRLGVTRSAVLLQIKDKRLAKGVTCKKIGNTYVIEVKGKKENE